MIFKLGRLMSTQFFCKLRKRGAGQTHLTMRLLFTIYDLLITYAQRLAALMYDVRFTICGVRRLRREFGERKGFLRAIIMMTARCHDF